MRNCTASCAQRVATHQAQHLACGVFQELVCTLEASAELGSSSLLACVGSAAVDLRALAGAGAGAEVALRVPLAGRCVPALCRDAELLISVAAHDLPRMSVLVGCP